MLQQGNLVLLLLLFEIPDGVFLCPPFLFKNEIQVCQPVHFIFNPDDVLAVQLHTGQAHKHAVTDGILDPDPLVRIVGWDIAVDEEGDPVFIEFNCNPGQNQMTYGPTFGDYTDEVLEEVFGVNK